MSLMYRFTPLDDVYAFLAQVRGLPTVPTAERRARRCVRACILLSWIALEESLDHAIELWIREGGTSGPCQTP